MNVEQNASAPATKSLPESQIIDVIVYTASLISDTTKIDSALDVMRRITSRNRTTLETSDIARLHGVQQRLERVLVHQEPFRSFSYNTLHTHIQRHFSGGGNRTRSLLRITVAGIILFALGLATIPFIIDTGMPDDLRSATSVSLVYTVFYAGSAAFILSARKELTNEVRSAYNDISLALILAAAAVPIEPLTVLLGYQDSPFAPVVMMVPLAAAYFPLYNGTRKLALLVTVRSRLTSIKFAALASAVLILACIGIAALTADARPGPQPTLYVIATTISHGLVWLWLIMGFILLLKVKATLSFLYTRPINALIWAVATDIVVATYFIAYWFTGHSISGNVYLNAGVLGLVVVSSLFLNAGYQLKKTHIS